MYHLRCVVKETGTLFSHIVKEKVYYLSYGSTWKLEAEGSTAMGKLSEVLLGLVVVVCIIGVYFYFNRGNFDYHVRVEDRIAGNPIDRAEVSIIVPGLPPLSAMTGNDGYASIRIPAMYNNQSGELTAKADGFKVYHVNVFLTQDLPRPILMDPEEIPLPPTETPLPPTDTLTGETEPPTNNQDLCELYEIQIDSPQDNSVESNSTVRITGRHKNFTEANSVGKIGLLTFTDERKYWPEYIVDFPDDGNWKGGVKLCMNQHRYDVTVIVAIVGPASLNWWTRDDTGGTVRLVQTYHQISMYVIP